jgi:hypothetical protein
LYSTFYIQHLNQDSLSMSLKIPQKATLIGVQHTTM